MSNRVLALTLVALLLFVGAAAAAEDSMVGTWKLDLAKSTYNPGPAPQGEINHVESFGANGIKVTAEVTDPQGKKFTISFAGQFDGKEIAVTGDPNADTCVFKRLNDHAMQRVNKKAGKLTTRLKYVVSKDGRTKTIYTDGANAQGQQINNVAVFEKQ